MQDTIQQQIEQVTDDQSMKFDVGSADVQSGDLMASIDDMSSDLDVSGFTCVKCNLTHGHDTNKHKASDTFAFGEDEAASMEYSPNCHCSLNSLAAGIEDHSVDMTLEEASSTAPVPETVMQDIKSGR